MVQVVSVTESSITTKACFVAVDSQTRDLLRYSFGTLKCNSAILYRRSIQFQAWCKITNRKKFLPSVTSGSKIDRQVVWAIAFISYFRIISHWILFLSLDSFTCFFSGEDVYRLKFTRCILKTAAGFERAAPLTGREQKITAGAFFNWLSFLKWLSGVYSYIWLIDRFSSYSQLFPSIHLLLVLITW